MDGKVNATWLNMLIITVTVFIWLSVAGTIVAGIMIADAAADNCVGRTDENGYLCAN